MSRSFSLLQGNKKRWAREDKGLGCAPGVRVTRQRDEGAGLARMPKVQEVGSEQGPRDGRGRAAEGFPRGQVEPPWTGVSSRRPYGAIKCTERLESRVCSEEAEA